MTPPRPLRAGEFCVAISNADLLLYVDGEGDRLATLDGVVSASTHASIPVGLPYTVEFGPYDGEALGIYLTSRAGQVAFSYADEAELLEARLAQAMGGAGALFATITPKGEPRPVGNHGRHWWLAEVALGFNPGEGEPTAGVPEPRSLVDDLTIRVRRVDSSDAFHFEGRVHQSRRAVFEAGTPVQCVLSADGGNSLTRTEGGAARLEWSIGQVDEKHIAELVAMAEDVGAELEFELRLASSGCAEDSDRWPVEDLSMVAIGLLR